MESDGCITGERQVSRVLNIEKRTLILDRERCIRNIERMAAKARKSGVRFRPHFKTHQSAGVGEWFRDSGVECITVSSLDMATYFAGNGWKDITVAFPANLREVGRMNDLGAEIELNLLVESMETVRFLGENLSFDAHLWIKIDVGYGRTGIWWQDSDRLVQLAEGIGKSGTLSLRGILTHSGHSYDARSKNQIEEVYLETVSRMRTVQESLASAGFADLESSIGDTPTCSVVEDLSQVDEIRPGNFVFYDVMQLRLGSCSEEEIAVAVACPVVAKHGERNEVVIYGGAVHLSEEFIVQDDGAKVFGYVALGQERGWGPVVEDAYVSSLSQEHGIVRTSEELFHELQIGDLLMVLPVHSCLTANLMGRYLTLDGEIVDSMRIP